MHLAIHTNSSIVSHVPDHTQRTPRPLKRGITVAVACALVLAACTGDDDATPAITAVPTTITTLPPRPENGILSIGIFLPTTGPGATLGAPMIEATVGAIEHINDSGGVLGNDVEFEIVDENSENGLIDLLDSDVDAIIGPASSLVALSQLEPAVEQNSGVVVCSPSATALALDGFPDRGYFFRTAPSDALQMTAIARTAAGTGASSLAVAYLDDPYGRGLLDSLTREVTTRDRLDIVGQVGYTGDEDDLSEIARSLLDAEPGAIVLLADADTGGRLLVALDEASAGEVAPQIILNDSVRSARQVIAGLTPLLRQRTTGVAPRSTPDGTAVDGAFTAHAADCVNLIALAAVETESDAPGLFKRNIAAVSRDGRACTAFEDCAELIELNLRIDYDGESGPVELSPTTGNVVSAWFETFGFDGEGNEVIAQQFRVP